MGLFIHPFKLPKKYLPPMPYILASIHIVTIIIACLEKTIMVADLTIVAVLNVVHVEATLIVLAIIKVVGNVTSVDLHNVIQMYY